MPSYEPSELPPDDADFGPSDDEIAAELLTLAWEFFNQASLATREELRHFLTDHGHHPAAGIGAFLDGLQFSAEARVHHPRGEPPAT